MSGRAALATGVVVAAVLALATVVLAASKGKPPISMRTQDALWRWALTNSEQSGDAHPYDVKAVKTTYLRAEEVVGGDRSSGQADNATVYLLAMRGHFTASHASVPLGAPVPTGTVSGAIFTLSLRVTDGFLNRTYPRLSRVGRPVSLGPERASQRLP